MDHPCDSLQTGHIVLGLINAFQAIAIAWLVNRSYRADKRDNRGNYDKIVQDILDQRRAEREAARRRNSEEP